MRRREKVKAVGESLNKAKAAKILIRNKKNKKKAQSEVQEICPVCPVIPSFKRREKLVF